MERCLGRYSPIRWIHSSQGIRSNGRTLQFITYYGGTQAPLNYSIDSPSGIAVDQEGVIYVAGNTTSLNLPIVGSARADRSDRTGAGVPSSDSQKTEHRSSCQPTSGRVQPLTPPLSLIWRLKGYAHLVGSGDLGSIPIAPGAGSGWLLRLTVDGVPWRHGESEESPLRWP